MFNGKKINELSNGEYIVRSENYCEDERLTGCNDTFSKILMGIMTVGIIICVALVVL